MATMGIVFQQTLAVHFHLEQKLIPGHTGEHADRSTVVASFRRSICLEANCHT